MRFRLIDRFRRRYRAGSPSEATGRSWSRDDTPYLHPALNGEYLRAIAEYSRSVWQYGAEYLARRPTPPRCAFAVNLAQNMNVWARLVRAQGLPVTLFVNPMDGSAISTPEWEDHDGEFANIADGAGFLRLLEGTAGEGYEKPTMSGADLFQAWQEFSCGDRGALLRIASENPTLRLEALMHYEGAYPYFAWAKALASYQVIYIANSPFPAYASGRPYLAVSLGSDMRIYCGEPSEWGRLTTLCYAAARFSVISNPQTVGHHRRLGLRNGIYLPNPVDDARYCPGPAVARSNWEARYGRGIYVLNTCRIDTALKGQGPEYLEAIVRLVRRHADLHVLYLGWGADLAAFSEAIATHGIRERVHLLPVVGKKRLIDYYRSCDIVVDQLVLGYYGMTALEAAAVGKPVVMHLRQDQYRPFYGNDVAPVVNVSSVAEFYNALDDLLVNRAALPQMGARLREWLVRNHGAQRTAPLLSGLLALAADQVILPKGIANPFARPYTADEVAYHLRCQHQVTH